MIRRRLAPFAALVLLSATAACGDSVIMEEPPGTGGGSEGGGAGGPGVGGSGGVMTGTQSIQEISAPTETKIHLEFAQPLGGAATAAMELSSWTVDSVYGPVAVEGITLHEDGRSIELFTTKQKLGVTYDVSFDAGEEIFAEDVLAADTARFWVTDLASPQFAQIEMVAYRQEIGPHVVIYVQEGEAMANASTVVSHFEQDVYPTETAAFIEAPDRDGNGRIVLLGVDGKGAFGGYFNPIDTMEDEQTFQQWGYHSNEKEMLYLNVESGMLQGASVVVPHELSHLLYQELHPSLFEDWPYHNEGLAECAVNLVNGAHEYALDVYVADPLGDLANGKSLVNWEYGNYSQYAQAYVFWSYVAGQMEGVPSYADLMMQDGHPNQMQAYLQQTLGKSFSETQLSALLATWAQHPSGEHSFNGVLTMPAKPKVAASPSLSLTPFTGVFVSSGQPNVDYPGTQGADILYAGVNGAGVVDLAAPFDVDGGALIVLNTAFDLDEAPEPQPIGLFPTSLGTSTTAASPELTARSRAWLHPPPFNPAHLERMHAWRERTRL